MRRVTVTVQCTTSSWTGSNRTCYWSRQLRKQAQTNFQVINHFPHFYCFLFCFFFKVNKHQINKQVTCCVVLQVKTQTVVDSKRQDTTYTLTRVEQIEMNGTAIQNNTTLYRYACDFLQKIRTSREGLWLLKSGFSLTNPDVSVSLFAQFSIFIFGWSVRIVSFVSAHYTVHPHFSDCRNSKTGERGFMLNQGKGSEAVGQAREESLYNFLNRN